MSNRDQRGSPEPPSAGKPSELVVVTLTFTQAAMNFISVNCAFLSYVFIFSLFYSPPFIPTGLFAGIRNNSQATITSGRVTSWTSSAFTSPKSSRTGRTPCSAAFTPPNPPTAASSKPPSPGARGVHEQLRPQLFSEQQMLAGLRDPSLRLGTRCCTK